MIVNNYDKVPLNIELSSRREANPAGSKVNDWVKKAKIFTLIAGAVAISGTLALGVFCVIPMQAAITASITLLVVTVVAYLVLKSFEKQKKQAVASVSPEQLLEKVANRHALSKQESKVLLDSLEQARTSLYVKETEELRLELKNNREIDPEVADEIVDFLKNSTEKSLSMFAAESRQDIIQRAKDATQSKNRKLLLQQLRVDLENRAIPPDESLIKRMKKYQSLTTDGASHELQAVINQWFLNQELKARKNPALMQHPKIEAAVLSGMNYLQADDYEHRAQVQKMTEQFIIEYMGGESLGCKSLNELKLELQDKLLDVRLESLPKAKIHKESVKLLIDLALQAAPHVSRKKVEAKQKLIDEIEADPLLAPLPLAREYIKKEINDHFDSINVIKLFFRANQKTINEKIAADDQEILRAEIERLFPKYVDYNMHKNSLGVAESLTDVINFYRRWSGNIVKEAIQGFKNEQEVLGDGVCFALSLNYAVLEQLNPDISLEALKIGQIRPDHRFKQVWLNENKRVEKRIISDSLAQKLGFSKSEAIITTNLPQKFKESFLQKFNEGALQESNGVTFVAIYFPEGGGHAIHLRADSKRNVYHLQDPVLGVLEIPYDINKTPEEHAKMLLEATDDLYNLFYRKVNRIVVNQLKA